MRRKKIGIFTGYFLPHTGGVERYVDKISTALYRIGYDVVIVTSNHNDAQNYEKSKAYSIYRLPILNLVKERYPIPKINAEYKELISKIENEKIDYFIVNTRFHLTSLIGARMGKRHNKPVVLIEHGTDHFTVGNKILDFFGLIYEHILTGVLKRYVDSFYGVSKNSNIWSKHFSIDADGVFYNAISIADKLKVKDYYNDAYADDEIIITYAGRLIKEKGVLNLFEAFKRLDKGLKPRLVIAGDGDLLEYIKSGYSQKNISILGRLDFDHVMAIYRRTDIFVYPSLYPEGLPTSILEAGLMDCAVIATPRGGTEEVIVDSSHGIIIDGSVDSIYHAMSKYIVDENARRLSALNIRKRIESTFEWTTVAEQVDLALKHLSKDRNNDK